MSSQLSNASTAVEWSSLHDSQVSSQLSSQSSQLSTEPHPLKPDRVQDLLSSSWASYISAQHTSREVSSLRQALDEQVKKLNVSLALLNRDLQDHQKVATTAAAQARETAEQIGSAVGQLTPLRDAFSLLQQEVRSSLERVSGTVCDAGEKLGALQGRVEARDIVVSEEVDSIQRQCASAFEAVEGLMREVRELRADKTVLEERVATLGGQLEAASQIQQEQLPDGSVELLTRLLSRQDELSELLELPKASTDAACCCGRNSPVPDAENGALRDIEEVSPDVSNGGSASQPTTASRSDQANARKRPPNKKGQASAAKRVPPPRGSDLKTLLLHFRDEYKARPPKLDNTFIWSFVNSIDNPRMSAHIQDCLRDMCPEWVSARPDLRLRPGSNGRYITIRRGLTWREFQRALLKMPALTDS